MPGYVVTPTEEVKEGLYCSHCRLLLRDAVQNEEGYRLCHGCCDEIRRGLYFFTYIKLIGI